MTYVADPCLRTGCSDFGPNREEQLDARVNLTSTTLFSAMTWCLGTSVSYTDRFIMAGVRIRWWCLQFRHICAIFSTHWNEYVIGNKRPIFYQSAVINTHPLWHLLLFGIFPLKFIFITSEPTVHTSIRSSDNTLYQALAADNARLSEYSQRKGRINSSFLLPLSTLHLRLSLPNVCYLRSISLLHVRKVICLQMLKNPIGFAVLLLWWLLKGRGSKMYGLRWRGFCVCTLE
jgi:hypothetical protein